MADLCTFDSTLTTFDTASKRFDQTTCQQVVQQQAVLVGGGDFVSWKDEIEARHRKRELERSLARLVREEKKLVEETKKTERKIEAERRQEKPIEGILCRYWEISLKVEEKKTEIRNVRQELEQAIWFLGQRIEDEEDDEEELLFLL